MTNSLDFYFDFISPYSYLAHNKLKKINKNDKFNINYKPILLGGLHKLGGITAPAFNERKMKNMKDDCLLIAIKNHIEFQWNSKFPVNTLTLMRGYLAIDQNSKKKFFDICFDTYWKYNADISDLNVLKKILKLTGLDEKNFFDKVQSEEIKDKLKKLTNDAFQKDIFGAPTFVVNNKIFWGQDRLEYALDEYNFT
tara:strand:+ start:112 stop:699 length:588 start_codon:yes stop_codon:yes gene_type:complete